MVQYVWGDFGLLYIRKLNMLVTQIDKIQSGHFIVTDKIELNTVWIYVYEILLMTPWW